ncbi:1-phosphofructokinase family hexose kinase [Leifsonia sp. SIMBA_070]|uniref:1-phosphofructokinase family hexose kinase n=1 Tax=Leifsonia sp. SIMBA_070 TaxID=3085810 RepID=UPI00397B3FAA
MTDGQQQDAMAEAVGRPDVESVPAGRAILVVGPNPAMDRTEEIADFRPHEVNRALRSSPRAGGKSFIVARALRRLRTPVSAYGFLGGPTGRYLRDACAALGIRDRHTEIAEETRINTILVDERTRLSTVINEPGPVVSPVEASALTAAIEEDLRPGDLLVLTGSLPPGCGDDLYGELIRLARAREAHVIVDADGDALLGAVAARPWAIKCNLAEFRGLRPDIPADVLTEEDLAALTAGMAAVVDSGIELVIVTLGAAGLIAATSGRVIEMDAPPVETKNATGSGDTLLAGLVSAIAGGGELEAALRLGVAAAAVNASVLIPDIGPDPDLDGLLAATHVRTRSVATARTLGARP